MGQSLIAVSLVVQLIIWLILGSLELRESSPYVPKRKRKPPRDIHFYLQTLYLKCTTTIMTRIDNIKVRRNSRTPGLRYSGYRHRRKKRKLVQYPFMTGMPSTWDNSHVSTRGTFDSDAQVLMLDDGASACITNDKSDFIEPPKWADRKVKGIKGHAHATHKGTIKWYLEDDQGLVHVMIIRGAYLIPDAPTCILSPQHLAQQADDHYPREEGTGALTTSKNVTLFWAQRRFSKTVPLDTKTNVGLTTTASGARSFRAFCATIQTPETMHPNIFTTHVIPDDDDESFQPKDPIEQVDSDTEERVDTPKKNRRSHDSGADTNHSGRPGPHHTRDPRGQRAELVGPSRRTTTLALLSGTLVVRTHTTPGMLRSAPQALADLQEAILHRVSIWETD